ncbi:cilia- and flagella-associated protein 276 [Diachasmimorpha longicaudata]|uniref:cilia- and flagella-associated protein 276 n=1 Tax=Diachasmimorpha longicaudata TaxID=58733 RepID=UPI0030B91C37
MPPRDLKRNPYPVPDVSTEGFWISDGPILGKNVSEKDRDWATRLEPHERLFAHHTLTSIRRDHRLIRPQVPDDALDLALSATYIHSQDTMVPKMYVIMQPESLNWETWRVLRNDTKVLKSKTKPRDTPPKKPPLTKTKTSAKPKKSAAPGGGRGAVRDTGSAAPRKGDEDDDILDKEHRRLTYAAQMMAIERIHPSSLKLAIDGPHIGLTNPGYSRKIDGTFYSI